MKWSLLLLGAFYVCSETLIRQSIFDTSAGYSVSWLAFLYLVGGYISYYGISHKIRIRKSALLFIGFTSATWLSKMILDYMSYHYLGEVRFGMWLYTYTSPTVLGAAIALLLCFANCKIKHVKMISILSPLTFGVFLIHTNKILLEKLCGVFIGDISQMHWIFVIPSVLFGAICVFLICGLIEYLRLLLVKKIRLKESVLALEEKIFQS